MQPFISGNNNHTNTSVITFFLCADRDIDLALVRSREKETPTICAETKRMHLFPESTRSNEPWIKHCLCWGSIFFQREMKQLLSKLGKEKEKHKERKSKFRQNKNDNLYFWSSANEFLSFFLFPLLLFFFFNILSCLWCIAYGISVTPPGIKPALPALETWS